jgi:hypothetical protein
MNSVLLHVADAPPTGGVPRLRSMEAERESGGSFSEHLEEAVASRSEALSGNRDLRATAAKSTASGIGSNTPRCGAEQADSEGEPGSPNNPRVKKGASADPSTPNRTGEQVPNAAEPRGSAAGASVSHGQSGALSVGQFSIAQPAACVSGELSFPEAALETMNKPTQSSVALGTLVETQLGIPVSSSCDFTLAVTQPMSAGETNSVQVGAEAVDRAVEPGSTDNPTLSPLGSTDAAGGSGSCDDAAIGGKNDSAATRTSDLSDAGQTSLSDSEVALEPSPVEPALAADSKEASQDNSRAGDESASSKPGALHDADSAAASASRDSALSVPASLSGLLNVFPPVPTAADAGNVFIGPASSGHAGAQAAPSTHSSAPPIPASSATGVESGQSDQALTWSVPASAWDGALSGSLTGPLAASAMGGSVDHPLPVGSGLNGMGFGSPASTTVVAVQPGSGPELASDSSPQGPAQAEGTPRPTGDEILEAWQTAQLERVNGAALSSLPSGTEMRVQMHTDAFGPLDIRATLEAGKIGAAIGVENAEAHHTLLGQVSALQQVLADKHVQLDNVTVVRTPAQNSTDLGWSPNQQRDDAERFSRLAQQAHGQGSASQPAFVPEAEAAQTEHLWGRLSVRA